MASIILRKRGRRPHPNPLPEGEGTLETPSKTHPRAGFEGNLIVV